MPPLARLACAALLAAVSAAAQMQESVNVHVVEVPVTVVDRDGQPVRGLTPANFELLDGGKKQAIASFDAIDFASYESLSSVSRLNPVARRNFLLLFDLSFSSPASIAKAQLAARDFIARGAARRDLIGVATVDADRGFRLLTAFTTDRNLLTAAVADPRSFRGTDPLQIAGTPIVDMIGMTNPGEMPSGRIDEGAMMFKEMMKAQERLDDQFMRTRILRQFGALGELAKTLRALPGRKQIIMFSEGFDPRLVRGRDAGTTPEEREELEQIINGEVWRTDPDARYGTSDAHDALRRMAHEFRAADVVLHAIDTKGVRVNNDLVHGARLNSNDALFLLANPTGGAVFQNSNNVGDDLQRMLKAQEAVYVLSFRAPAEKAGTFHELKVRLVDAPRGSRVFHRAGYYESGPQSPLERSLTNAEIILNDIPQSEIHVDALVAAFPTTDVRSQVPVVLEIDGPSLLRGLTSSVAIADVFVYAFDDEGLVRDRLYQRLTLDTGKIGAQLRGSGVKYYGTLSLPEGRYEVKSLVRVAESERRGFARVDVVVPNANDVAVLPPLFFDAPSEWLLVRGASHDKTAAAYPFMLNGEPFMPSAAARVKNGESRRYAMFVFNANAEELAFETAAGGAAITPRVVSQVRARDAELMKVVFELAPLGLATGSSTLDVTVRSKGSADARKASVALVVK
jgi:VWFA-related protein